jgi:CRP-like cAMP-binding protein
VSGQLLTDVRPNGVRDNRILDAIPNLLTALGENLKEVSLSQGAILHEPGDPIDTVYFPHSGMVSLLVVSGDGGQIEVATIGREGAVGLNRGLGKRVAFTRATTQIPGQFSSIPAAAFERVAAENAPLRELIAHYTEWQWADAQQLVACNAMHDAASRLCRWLLQSADKVGGNQLALTQEFLSQMLGVRRTTVTLLAQDMQAKGLIRYTRGLIEILDRPRLEARTCECYHIMQHQRLPATSGINL